MVKKKQFVKNRFPLDKNKWVKKYFDGLLYTFFPVGDQALRPLNNYFGDSYSMTVFYVEEGNIHWFWHRGDMERLHLALIDRVRQESNFLASLRSDWEEQVAIFKRIIKKTRQVDLSKLSDVDLIELHDEYYHAYINQYGLAIGLQDAFSMLEADLIQPIIRKELSGQLSAAHIAEIYPLLFQTDHRSFLSQERIDLLNIADRIANSSQWNPQFRNMINPKELEKKVRQDKELYSLFRRHANNFYWLRNNYKSTYELDEIHFLAEVQSILQSGKSPSELIENDSRQMSELSDAREKILKKVELSENSLIRMNISRQFAYMQDERKRYVYIANGFFELVRREVCRRTGLELQDVDYAVPLELSSLLKNGTKLKKELQARKKGTLCLQDLSGYQLIVGKPAKKLRQQHLESSGLNRTEVLRGTSVWPGKVVGDVFIIKSEEDIFKFPKGAVLVVSMARPEHDPAISLSSAIVTDEGGICSHAATRSREEKKPCVIGTNYATAKFKNGDRVIVDANEGTVKLL